MMKKAVLVIVSLSVGVVIGYLYRDYHSIGYNEAIRVFEDRKQNVNVPRNVYYTGEEDWEDLFFQECNDFGPV